MRSFVPPANLARSRTSGSISPRPVTELTNTGNRAKRKAFSRVFKYKAEDWVNPGWEFLKREWRKDRESLESLEDTVSKLREDCGYFVINGGLLKLWSRRYDDDGIG